MGTLLLFGFFFFPINFLAFSWGGKMEDGMWAQRGEVNIAGGIV
jgi:hypothetical protein